MPHVDEELLKQSGVKTGETMPEEPIKQDCEEVAEQAWEATRDTGDPVWGLTPTTHRETLLYATQSVKRSKLASTPFERAVAKLLKPTKVVEATDTFDGLHVHDDGGDGKSKPAKKKSAASAATKETK